MHVKNMEAWEVCVGMRSISGPDTSAEKLSMLGEVVHARRSCPGWRELNPAHSFIC
jgi:hypothetical protein